MARKIPGLSRVLGPGSVASVAYGEIASSIYFALGIVALHALGFTPWVLLAVGLLFLLVALSYAEGTAAIAEAGGGATFVRRAFNDPAGFLTGWALLLDYVIVIALAAVFATQYFSRVVGWNGLTRRPWDVVAAVVLIALVAGIRLIRRTAIYQIAVLVAIAAFASHLVIIVLGFAFLFSTHSLGLGVDLGVAPTWSSIVFALPLAMLAYTGLETVANFAEEIREPGRTLPRSLFAGIGAVVAVSVAIGVVGISAYPAHRTGASGHWSTDLGTDWLRAPIVGIVAAFHGHLPHAAVQTLRIALGVTGTVILIAAVTTSISGAGRLAYSLGQHDMLPHRFGVRNRRTGIPPVSIVGAALVASTLLVIGAALGREVSFLASLYSFGILAAFTAAQLAVIRLRFKEPGLERPFRVPVNVRLRGVAVPVAALVGAPLTFAVWIATLATHGATRVAGPAWILFGAVVFAVVRRSSGEGLMQHVEPAPGDLVPAPEGIYQRILVPMKLGPIGEEVLATAIKLAEERGGSILALHVIAVPLKLPLDAPMAEEEQRAVASLEEARTLAEEHGVEVETAIVRARSLGEAIVAEADRWGADLILMGSAPRWRRQSRFFSPTVDYVLRRAGSEVMVVAYPQGVLEEDFAPA